MSKLVPECLACSEKEKAHVLKGCCEMNFARFLACLLVCACLLNAAPAVNINDEMHGQDETPERLGKVSFPVSCAPTSQKSFERGIALLHSFGYEDAQEQFAEIAKNDPTCAMAHWGVAMSLFHEIWEEPLDESLRQGQEEIDKAQKIGAKTERERGYISALALFYRDPAKNNHATRAAAYSEAMGKLYQQYPSDVEAGAFYGLALLAAAPPADTSHTAAKKAVEVLNKLFQQQPDHPGLAHYIIHACDSPEMASLALDAARRYAEIAPSSAHAVHMPSHIFARLGLWQEDIRVNLTSVALAQSSGAMYMHGHELHALHFLMYAYLQTGQDESARQVLEQAMRITAMDANGDDAGMKDYYGRAAAHFPALYDLEMRRWSDAATLEPAPGAPPHLQMITYWARTIATAHLGIIEATRQNATKYDEAEQATRKSRYAYLMDQSRLSREEVHAWLAFAEKKGDEALRAMRDAADTQDKVGKEEVDIPAREMLADMLLELGRPKEAMAEYEKSMKIYPNRFNGLAGTAQAAELAGRADKAKTYYGQLLRNCDEGRHSSRQELRHAKQVIAKND
jgi:tetratricopeptide (TPR) repeat protein